MEISRPDVLIWGGFSQRFAVLTMVLLAMLTLAGAGAAAEALLDDAHAEAQQMMSRRWAQAEQDDAGNEDGQLGVGDSGCLKGLLNALTSVAHQNSSALVSTWTPQALASPCNHTSQLTGVACNNMSRVASIRLPSANLVGSLPSSLSLCSSLTTLIMPGNSLTGFLPTSLGDLPYLSTLSLSHNQLSGPIPLELSTCFALSSLDLHHNQLSGSIPGQLGLLPLQHFNVSDNRLSGLIPSTLSNTSTGAPRFSASSFDHNPNLYGYPLVSTTSSNYSPSGKDYTRMVYAATIAVVVVVVVVLLIVVCCWIARFYQAAKKQRRELAERELRRNVGCSSSYTDQQEDGWKKILTQL